MYELAVIDSYTEQQFENLDTSNLDQVAELLGKEYLALQADEASVEGRKAKLDFLAADAFIVMRRLLGIKPGGVNQHNKDSRDVTQNQKLNAWCVKAGRKRRTLERDAVTAKKWPKGDRVPGLTFGHYQAVEGMDHADARKLLLDAQMGEPKHVYRSTEWVKAWSVIRLRKERKAFEGDPKEKVESDARGDTVKSKHEMLAKIAKILGADTPKNRRMIKIIEKEVEAVYVQIRDNFTKSFDDAVEKEKTKLSEMRIEQIEKRDRYLKLCDELPKPLTAQEWTILRKFCHPDKHVGDEARAGQAYEIVRMLGDKMEYTKRKGRAA